MYDLWMSDENGFNLVSRHWSLSDGKAKAREIVEGRGWAVRACLCVGRGRHMMTLWSVRGGAWPFGKEV